MKKLLSAMILAMLIAPIGMQAAKKAKKVDVPMRPGTINISLLP